MGDAPGISFKELLDGASDTALRDYVGSATVNVVAVLDSSLLTHDNLVRLAEDAHTLTDVLKSRELRARIVDFLPLVKAEELAAKMGISGKGAQLYELLAEGLKSRANDATVLGFFGVVISQERAPTDVRSAELLVTPKYGLFPHQLRVAKRAVEAMTEEPHVVVIHMPTGAGKTRTAMHVVAEFLQRHPDRLVIWLAQTAELLEQAATEFEKAWSALGCFPAMVYRFWGESEPDLQDARTGFLVAGFGKLHALYKRDANMIMRLGDRVSLLVVDEAHQGLAPTFRKLIDHIYGKDPANSLLGLTATPGRTWANISEDAELADLFFNRKVTLQIDGYDNPVHYLIEQGYLAQPKFVTLNAKGGFNPSQADLKELGAQYEVPISIIERLAADDQRNIQIVRCIEDLATRHSRIIVFAASVDHAHRISSILKLRGLRSFVVTGETDKSERERILYRFKSADPSTNIICNFGVLTTGFDAPRTSAAVIARPTRSLVLFSQMVGRAIRGERAGGNRSAEIVTVVDPQLPGFGDLAEAFTNWEDVWSNV